MDEWFASLLAFIRQNILVFILFFFGSVLLIYGLILFISTDDKSSDEIVFTNDDTFEEEIESDILTIDVAGGVKNPGVYDLASGSRLKDAISKAGGFSDQADTVAIAQTINLASLVEDGVKIYIPVKGEASVAGASSKSSLININTATATELDTLPGVGSVTSAKIISGRPYANVSELASKKIVSEKVYGQIKDLVRAY